MQSTNTARNVLVSICSQVFDCCVEQSFEEPICIPIGTDNEECNAFELLPPIEQGQSSNDNPPVPCGFTGPDGSFVNECSPCGNKIADDNCSDTPIGSLCDLDGFQSTVTGFTNDLAIATLGFCGPGTGTHNNFWVGFTAQTNVLELLVTSSNCINPPGSNAIGIQVALSLIHI